MPKSNKTYIPTRLEAESSRKWVQVDAAGQTLGRVASRIASILRGKNKVTYTPHLNCGDYVVVINASKVKLSGSKLESKLYSRYTGYVGGLKRVKASDLLNAKPERLIEHAVRGMLPSGPLARAILKKLKVYSGSNHPHVAQKPLALSNN